MIHMSQFKGSDYWNIKEKYNFNELNKMVLSYLSTKQHKQNQDRSKARRDKIKFYPSSIGQSDYDIVMSMLGYVGKPTRGEFLMIMENGTSFHNRIEHIFEEMGILIAPELSLKDEELHISGRSDAIIWNYLKEPDEEDGEEIELIDPSGKSIYKGPENNVLLVEFKSISENGFERLRKSKPNDEHNDQLQLYFYLTGITKGLIYYENKNNQKVVEYIVERNEDDIKRITNRIRRLIKRAEERDIPEPDYKPTDFEGRYSRYVDMAYPNLNPVSFEDVFELEGDSMVETTETETDTEFPF